MSTVTQAGKKALVKVASSTSSLSTIVAGVREFTHTLDGHTVDDSEFSIEWVQKIGNLNDAKVTMKGQRRATDTLGQSVLLAALLSGDTVYLQVRGLNQYEYRQQMLVSKFETKVDVSGIAEWECELQGDGPISLQVAGAGIGTEDRNYLGTEDSNILGTEY